MTGERGNRVRYTVQQGVLKNVWLRFRNGMLRGDLANDVINENRLYIGYSYHW